ncbi:hypothetical protein BV22DRAFT_1108330 [Leucogyrophana mollusca]|uniref:Uncharacterized protein n=1 Tax=Leucogyrophana mollusca TaxID=85980 RepID=A0ACB8AYR1_9AGAM|nr:hypothetical protein BV22DRAFT_1108330 [Leucogyrophana mollusca]
MHAPIGALERASPFDLMLVSRCRASRITYHFSYKPGSAQHQPEEASQRYNKGNVAVLPQDSTQLRDVLPPGHDEIRDTMCALFTGANVAPTRELLMKMKPVLVTKSVVKTLIEFLIANNSWYQTAGVVFSQPNFDALFREGEEELDTSILQAVEICYLPKEPTEFGTSASVSRYEAGHNEASGDIVMESVGYTSGHRTPATREAMKLQALAYALDHKQFIASRTGSKYVSDEDPGLMSYLFPHLDPWNIGGFHHAESVNLQSRSELCIHMLEHDTKEGG